jgi:hypothetical protein
MCPSAIRFSRICREVGFTSNETRSWTRRPLTISAAIAKSRYPGLADEPTYAW